MARTRAPYLYEVKGRDETSLTGLIVDYIDKNFADDISLRDVAEVFGYTPCHLTHVFRRSMGLPITAWIIKRRITAACELFSTSDARVATVCEKVGFRDLCHFTRQFVRHAGTTPGRFRTAMRVRRISDGDALLETG